MLIQSLSIVVEHLNHSAMALCGLSNPSSSHHSHLLHNLAATPPHRKPKASFSSPTLSPPLAVSLGRRILSLSIVGFVASLELPLCLPMALASPAPEPELVSYTDSQEGFTLLVPSSWIKVDKAGATVLFEDPNKKANNVGVVVNPTRISSLSEFGTPEFVADKLIQAERRKESTKEAEVISFSERSGQAGTKVYEFEYKVDSTRGGLKRIFSAAFVASKKLYLLNITQSDGLENSLDVERRMMLEQVLHSFDAISST
ncbi:psbP domain-containing protein 2, chloroplastic [Andrographis paniculata]|uniref:psbP domain-containing protein 2, chloroplastic n=1 Tax=Andrographis paniculata TaxID=175694 RepID=UPI0021E7D813|nr:psbP domain-containing protein 2, chloroplastic [Andrographis paniculata]XP_051126876.1 psbP domain-containing protein 2, chloroplastic [Andrographis paniculata]